MTAYLLSRFRLTLSRASVRRYLKAKGWRWARPRLAPARKVDPEKAAKLAALAAAAQAVAAGAGHLLYLDECDLHLLPVIRAMWMKGPRRRVPTPGTNAKRAFFGALHAASGRWHWLDQERKLAVHFVAFLEQLASAYPTGTLYLAMDNVATHHAKVGTALAGGAPARAGALAAQVRCARRQSCRAHLGAAQDGRRRQPLGRHAQRLGRGGPSLLPRAAFLSGRRARATTGPGGGRLIPLVTYAHLLSVTVHRRCSGWQSRRGCTAEAKPASYMAVVRVDHGLRRTAVTIGVLLKAGEPTRRIRVLEGHYMPCAATIGRVTDDQVVESRHLTRRTGGRHPRGSRGIIGYLERSSNRQEGGPRVQDVGHLLDSQCHVKIVCWPHGRRQPAVKRLGDSAGPWHSVRRCPARRPQDWRRSSWKRGRSADW